MPNNYFKFKKFIIIQDKCAMKVCTDACLFGAFLPIIQLPNAKALEIGTGTGLLSLMFAQKNESSNIEAIEIDENAYQQAVNNISSSNYKNKINIVLGDIKTFQTAHLYDIIFSNPPFFVNDLKSQKIERNIAMHSQYLSYEDLIIVVAKLLKTGGMFYVLLPYNNENAFIAIALQHQLFVNKITRVKQTSNHPFFRSIICFAKQEKELIETNTIVIKEGVDYSKEFTSLLKEYYLFL